MIPVPQEIGKAFNESGQRWVTANLATPQGTEVLRLALAEWKAQKETRTELPRAG